MKLANGAKIEALHVYRDLNNRAFSGVVLAEFRGECVTWTVWESSDQEELLVLMTGTGHYFESRLAAYQDFHKRVEEQ